MADKRAPPRHPFYSHTSWQGRKIGDYQGTSGVPAFTDLHHPAKAIPPCWLNARAKRKTGGVGGVTQDSAEGLGNEA